MTDAPSKFFAFALTLLIATTVFAAPKPQAEDPCAIPAAIRDGPPIQDGTPVKVSIGVVLIDLSEINDTDQTFRADVAASLKWSDPRLSAKARGGSLADCGLTLKDIWHPDARTMNLRIQYRAIGERLPPGTSLC